MTIIVITQKVCKFYKCVLIFFSLYDFSCIHRFACILYTMFLLIVLTTLYTFWESGSLTWSCHNQQRIVFIILIIIIVTFYSLLKNTPLHVYHLFVLINNQTVSQVLQHKRVKIIKVQNTKFWNCKIKKEKKLFRLNDGYFSVNRETVLNLIL